MYIINVNRVQCRINQQLMIDPLNIQWNYWLAGCHAALTP